ncbi:MAG: cytochrome P450 [Rhizobiaceae bacterium]|nr:cytochrome P450 [Rhizobiaceae bacterium]
MDSAPAPFVPPAPSPRTVPPNLLKMFWIVYNNPIELWGEPSYTLPYVYVRPGIGGPLLVANDPSLIRHILVEKQKSFKLARVRQLVLKPILDDGLLTAENPVWKRSRKAMAPVFTPRHINGFADAMLRKTHEFADRYDRRSGSFDVAQDMTELTFEILAETLFSGQIAGDPQEFGEKVEHLFETVARVDPFDILHFPEWVPRYSRVRGRRTLQYFFNIVRETVDMRKAMMEKGKEVPDDFLTLLLSLEGPEGLSRKEIDDNVITFFGAGYETTARALGWTLYLLAKAPHERAKVEEEVRRVTSSVSNPAQWIDAMPYTRACFEEAMRLYPPAPTLSREAVEDTEWQGVTITKGTQAMIMPWTLHRHREFWEQPDAFMPSRFLPGNREQIEKYQYLPFGAGPRICIGASFALQEAMIALGVLLSRFRFDMAEGAPEPWPVQKLTTQPKGGLHMVATRL